MLIMMWMLVLALALPVQAQDRGLEKEWKEILAAARKEGKVVVKGPPDQATRRDLPAKFWARFGIEMEYLGGRSGDIVSRIVNERQAGIYAVDVLLGGVQTMGEVLYQGKMLEPLRPKLILPEVVDPTKWRKGKLWFADPEETYILRLLNFGTELLSINTHYVKPGEIQSMRDLLQPKWRGKIAARDPSASGFGSALAAAFYVQFGEEFVKKLYAGQNVVITRDERQLSDWLAHGIYPVVIAGGTGVYKIKEEGFPIEIVYSLSDLAGIVSSGSGYMSLVNKSPRANAARVFANWLASREGLEVYARANLTPSTRNDIDESFVQPADKIPRPGVNYFDISAWDFSLNQVRSVSKRMEEILKKK